MVLGKGMRSVVIKNGVIMIAGVLLLFGLSATACGGNTTPTVAISESFVTSKALSAASNGGLWQVSIQPAFYSPEVLTIKVGDTVIWINDDDKNRTILHGTNISPRMAGSLPISV